MSAINKTKETRCIGPHGGRNTRYSPVKFKLHRNMSDGSPTCLGCPFLHPKFIDSTYECTLHAVTLNKKPTKKHIGSDNGFYFHGYTIVPCDICGPWLLAGRDKYEQDDKSKDLEVNPSVTVWIERGGSCVGCSLLHTRTYSGGMCVCRGNVESPEPNHLHTIGSNRCPLLKKYQQPIWNIPENSVIISKDTEWF